LNENKTKSGVFTTESGLQYQVITEGTGPKPKVENTVKVHYTGKYLDGSVFDSSVERGQPAEFPLDRVIPGFSQGLQLMPVGSKYIIWIPVELGYGMSNPGIPNFKPNALYIFEVELLEIVKDAAQ
jgi:FKBP-type peptidyl-prolyl cis-trans isomerase